MKVQNAKAESGPILKSLTGHCPRCGKGRLFEGFLKVAPKCDSCGLNYDFDSADGPAVFVVLLAGFVITAAALLVEILYQPPYWVHAALWLPLAIGLPLLMLPPLKGLMIWAQHRNGAKEARFDHNGVEL